MPREEVLIQKQLSAKQWTLVDPGSKTTGLALVQANKVIWGAELTHRGQQIKNDLESRRESSKTQVLQINL